MNSRHPTLWLLSFGAAVAMAAAVTGCSRGGPEQAEQWTDPPPLQVETAQVVEDHIHETLQFNGSLIPFRFANVVSEVDGVIKEIPAGSEKLTYRSGGRTVSRALPLDIGHRVKAGQPLVEIDPVDCQLALEAARAKLKLAENELAKLRVWRREEERQQLKTQYDEATAVLEQRLKSKARAEALFQKNALSREEYDQAVMAAAVAMAIQKRAEAAWEVAKAGPTQEELAIAEANVEMAAVEVKLREEKREKCTIRAPYDAVIVERYVGVGDRVTALPRVEIMQIVDPSILFAEVAVPERYQGLVRVGDSARLHVRGVTDRQIRSSDGGEGIPAIVGLVNDKIDPETRTFRVRVGIENVDWTLKPGTFAEVELTVAAADRTVVAPAGAVTYAEGEPIVFVLQGNRVEQRPVKLGIVQRDRNDPRRDRCEVLAGLRPGERVVTGDATAILTDGMVVQVRGDQAKPTTEKMAAATAEVPR